ncbi:MAG: GNAT family N-acetyltransferase [Candidatus Binataceae bacterium]
MNFTIRLATPDDAETILRFIRGLAEYEHQLSAVSTDAAQIRAQMSSAQSPFECLLAESEGEVIGFALFFRNYSTWTGQAGLYLEDIFVPEKHRRHGAGAALMRKLAEITAERGWSRIDWSVLNWNRPAQNFYRALGARANDGWTTWRLDGPALARLARDG